MEILFSSDYKQFKPMAGNRPINRTRVKQIAESMRVFGYLPTFPIVVNDEETIRDGQHRFEAAKEAGVPYAYVICNLSLIAIRKAGALSAKWTITDQIVSRASMGQESYVLLREYIATSPFAPKATLVIMQRCYGKGQRNFFPDVNDGDFIHTDSFRAKYLLFQKYLAVFDKTFMKSLFALSAALNLFSHAEYDHSRMIEKLDYQSTRQVRCAALSDYQTLLFGIYNNKCLPKSRIQPETASAVAVRAWKTKRLLVAGQ